MKTMLRILALVFTIPIGFSIVVVAALAWDFFRLLRWPLRLIIAVAVYGFIGIWEWPDFEF